MLGFLSNELHRWDVQGTWFGSKVFSRPKNLSSELLILDWRSQFAAVSHYHQVNGQFVCLDTFQIEWNKDDSKLATEIGRLLESELKSRRIKATDVLVSVPRRFVVLKNITLPSDDSYDPAEAVQLQSEMLFPVSRDSLSIDFLSHGLQSDSGLQSIVIAALPLQVVQLIRESIEIAGLKPLMLGIGEFGLPLLDDSVANNSSRIDILFAESQVEYVLSHNSLPIVSYEGLISGNEKSKAAQISSTIKRLVTSIRPQWSAFSKPDVFVYGPLQGHLKKELEATYQSPIQVFPEKLPAQMKDLALIASYQNRSIAIDFLHPRKPVDQAARRTSNIVAGVLIAGVVFLLLALPFWIQQNRIERQLARAVALKDKLESDLNKLKPMEKAWKKLVGFERSRLDYSNEIESLIERLRSTEEIYLSNIEMSDLPNANTAVIRMKGRVKDRETFSRLTDELLAEGDRYQLRPPLLEPVQSDTQYAFSFTFEIELKSQSMRSRSEGRVP